MVEEFTKDRNICELLSGIISILFFCLIISSHLLAYYHNLISDENSRIIYFLGLIILPVFFSIIIGVFNGLLPRLAKITFLTLNILSICTIYFITVILIGIFEGYNTIYPFILSSLLTFIIIIAIIYISKKVRVNRNHKKKKIINSVL